MRCISTRCVPGADRTHSHTAHALAGKRVLLFSYGSGSVATMYAFKGREADDAKFALAETRRGEKRKRDDNSTQEDTRRERRRGPIQWDPGG